VKSRSYRHSGQTDSTHRCCYGCYQRSQFTQDNAEPSFLSVTNSLCQFTVPRTILKSPVPTTPMWARLTTVASQQASRSLGYVNNCTSHRLPKLGATSQRASVSCAVHQVGMELQSPVASTNCATPFHDIRHWLPAKHFPCHSAPAKVGRPLAQDSTTDMPIPAPPARSQAMK